MDNWIKFLGTAGARFVMIKQLRASGGLWICYQGINILIDPGPGSIVRCANSRPRLDPTKLDAIILTHRHLDHSNDVNVMIEAMTEGGFKKRGILFCPADALSEDPVVLRHTRTVLEKIEILKPDSEYEVSEFKFRTAKRHIHPTETYGIKFKANKKSVSLITDTRFFEDLIEDYEADILIINVVFYESREGVDHLSLADVKKLIEGIEPKTAILTHFGMTMLKAKPHILVEGLNKEFKDTEIIAAYDGMTYSL